MPVKEINQQSHLFYRVECTCSRSLITMPIMEHVSSSCQFSCPWQWVGCSVSTTNTTHSVQTRCSWSHIVCICLCSVITFGEQGYQCGFVNFCIGCEHYKENAMDVSSLIFYCLPQRLLPYSLYFHGSMKQKNKKILNS